MPRTASLGCPTTANGKSPGKSRELRLVYLMHQGFKPTFHHSPLLACLAGLFASLSFVESLFSYSSFGSLQRNQLSARLQALQTVAVNSKVGPVSTASVHPIHPVHWIPSSIHPVHKIYRPTNDRTGPLTSTSNFDPLLPKLIPRPTPRPRHHDRSEEKKRSC